MTTVPPLNPRERILMGPGPSTVPDRILRAISAPTLGHLDPQYIGYMDETCQMLRDVFQTKNALTFPVSGSGMAGMEAVVVNLVEPGDEVIVCVNGVFGAQLKDNMQRAGATVHTVKVPWGETFTGTLNCVSVPEGVDEAAIRQQLLNEYDIEIGGGLGVFAGNAWRIGLMGHSASHRNVRTLLAALENCLGSHEYT